MKPSDELRYDHEVLRGKLFVLEEHLPSCHDCGCMLSRLTDSLAGCLRSHTEREERVFAALAWEQGRPAGEALQHVHDEHENQRTRLAILHELLTRAAPASEEQVASQASCLAKDLREHMAMEERQLFPIIDGEAVGNAIITNDGEAAEMLGLA